MASKDRFKKMLPSLFVWYTNTVSFILLILYFICKLLSWKYNHENWNLQVIFYVYSKTVFFNIQVYEIKCLFKLIIPIVDILVINNG